MGLGSINCKVDLPLGADDESHRPDKVNFSHLRGYGRKTKVRTAHMSLISEEDESNVLEVAPSSSQADDAVPSPRSQGRIRHVSSVEETRVNVKEWHIAWLPKTSGKCCWAQRAVTKKKCLERIVRGAKPTPAPTYTGLWHNTRKNVQESSKFFFCSDDIERCVKGTRRKWVVPYSKEQERPSIPDVWPVKLGTNLKQSEILALEAAGFQLPQKVPVSPRRLFSTAKPPANLDTVPVPADADRYPGKREGKIVKRTAGRPNPQQRLCYGLFRVPQSSTPCCDNDSSPWPWLHHRSRLGNATRCDAVSDHNKLPTRLQLPCIQEDNDKVSWEEPVLILQACVLHLLEGLPSRSRC